MEEIKDYEELQVVQSTEEVKAEVETEAKAEVEKEPSFEDLRVTEQMRADLLGGMKWLKFISVIGAVVVGLLALMALLMLIYPIITGFSGENGILGLYSIVYIVIIALYIYPLIKAFRLVKNTRKAMKGNQEGFVQSADDFASIMRYCGYLTVIALILYIPVVLGAIILGFTID